VTTTQASAVPHDVAGPSQPAPEAVQTLRSLAMETFKDYSRYCQVGSPFPYTYLEYFLDLIAEVGEATKRVFR